MFTIQVIEARTGKPVEGVRVSVGFNGFFRAFTEDKYTDYNGEVHFDNENGMGTVYLNGSENYKGRIEGRKVLYI